MNTCDIPQLYACVLSIRSSIHDLFEETNKSLTDAKSTKKGNELNIYFDNYRKDKFLKECFMVFLNDIIKYIKSYPNYNIPENFTRLIILLSLVIDQHNTTVSINKLGQSNAMLHFSTQGIILTKSSNFYELHEIYKKLCYKHM